MAIRKYYDRHFLAVELFLSLAIAIFIITLGHFLMPNIQSAIVDFIHEKGDALFPLLASISAVLLGFILTGIMIILSLFRIPDTRLRHLIDTPHYENIFRIYFQAILCLAFTAIISFVAIILPPDGSVWLVYILVWLVIISFFRLARCIWALRHLVKISVKKNPI